MENQLIVPGTNQPTLATQAGQAALSLADTKHQVALIQDVMREVMKEGEHYGTIPGLGNKPALFKPGAEKLNLVFRMAPRYDVQIRDFENGHREYLIRCDLYSINTGTFLGAGQGSCSTLESKYRYRGEMTEDTGIPVPKDYWDIRKSDPKRAQQMIGDGFTTKKLDGRWFIVKKTGDRIENQDIADVYNTCLKMAKKRAHVDAVLTVTAASDIFAQDIEELPQSKPMTKPTTTMEADVVLTTQIPPAKPEEPLVTYAMGTIINEITQMLAEINKKDSVAMNEQLKTLSTEPDKKGILIADLPGVAKYRPQRMKTIHAKVLEEYRKAAGVQGNQG